MKPKFLTVVNHNIMLNLGCNCGVLYFDTAKAIIVKKKKKW